MRGLSLGLAFLLATGAVAVPAAGAAAPERAKYEQLYDRCISAAGNDADDVSPAQFNVVLDACAQDAILVAKQDINRLYAALEASLAADGNASALAKLERTQRAWIAYRDGHCELEGELVGTPAYSLCLLEVTGRRVRELEEIAR